MRPIICLAVWLLLGSPLLSQPPLEEWQIERYEWRGEVAPGTAIEAINQHGDLRIRSSDGHQVYLLANTQRHQDDPRRPEFRVDELEDKLRLQVLYPADDAGAAVPDAWRRRRVDLSLLVPPSAATLARTAGGLVEIKGLQGDIEATSATGDIVIRAAGRVVARTDHGTIFAQLRRSGWSDVASLETLTGDIRVELPRGGRASARLETRGEITTDYSIVVERQEGSLLKRATAEVGVGGSSLLLKSNRGAIKLLASLVPEETPES